MPYAGGIESFVVRLKGGLILDKSTFEYEKCTKAKKGKQKFALFF